MIFVGLHITKCAGTTLAMHVRSKLLPHRWYLCSGFRDMERLAVTQLAERLNFEDLHFIFGHFVHESLFSIAGERPLFLFTGVRAPVERAISEFYHICKIRLKVGKPPLTGDEFFDMRSNTMCVELLRAFPSVAPEGELAERAIKVVQMFDYIYDTENFAVSVKPLLELLRVGTEIERNMNLRGEEANDPALVQTESEIRERYAEHFDQDEKLFEFLTPHVGKMRPFGTAGMEDGKSFRERNESMLRVQPNGMDVLQLHFARAFVADYRNLDRMSELDELLARKTRWLEALKGFAGSRPPAL